MSRFGIALFGVILVAGTAGVARAQPDEPPAPDDSIIKRTIDAAEAEREAARVAAAERQYQLEAIRVGYDVASQPASYGAPLYGGGAAVPATTTLGRRWSASRESGGRLEGAAFYRVIGRRDLERSYRRRTRTAVGAIVIGAVVTVGCIVAASTVVNWDKDSAHGDEVGVVLGGLGGLTLAGAGTYGYVFRHPVNAAEALELSQDYNRDLRTRLGLPP
jgi:hypothetical protein